MAALTYTYTETFNEVVFADPYKKCLTCDGWVDGRLDAPGPITVTPCEHQAGYRDVCPSWSPVGGCGCRAWNTRYPTDAIVHEQRQPTPGDTRTY